MANLDEQETSGFLLLMLLAQELTNVSADLLWHENESLMCLMMALA